MLTLRCSSLMPTHRNFIIVFGSSIKQHFNTSSIVLIENSTSAIVQAFFKTNSTTLLYVIHLVGNSQYILAAYYLSTNLNQIIMPILPSVGTLIRTIKSDSRIYFLFNTGIYIYSQDTSLTLLNAIKFGVTATVCSMDASSKYLIYSIGSTINILNVTNATNLQLISTFNQTTAVDDARLALPFLMILTNNSLVQYDMNLKISIGNFSQNVTSAGWRMHVLMSKAIFIYQDYPAKFSSMIACMAN